jgi:signal peptidase I
MLVRSPSMSPALVPGDVLLLRPLWPWEDLPARGQVAAIRMPDGPIFLKRVVALPGETLQMRSGTLHLDGIPVQIEEVGPEGAPPFSTLALERLPSAQPHLIARPLLSGPLDDSARLQAPPGHVLVLGDHRGHSTDSRAPEGPGAVARPRIHGVVAAILLGPPGQRRARAVRRP